MSDSISGGLVTGNLETLDISEDSSSKKNYEFTSRTTNEEVKNIRLQPEQIEEINTDDYSLLLFNATRVEPLSLNQIKNHFPEPSSKKAKSVMDRFIECGLVHTNSEGKYYSNYPDHYIDYSLYRYDAILEAKKDAKVFDLMKENCSFKSYWKDKSYFSEDGFFTDEQSKEIAEELNNIRIKVKKFTSENRKNKKVSDLIFRRFKYYDMILGIALVFGLMFTNSVQTAFAQGNDPGSVFLSQQQSNVFENRDWQSGLSFKNRFNIDPLTTQEVIDRMVERRSIELIGGNDPGAALLIQAALFDPDFSVSDQGTNGFKDKTTYLVNAYGQSSLTNIVPKVDGGHDPGAIKEETDEIYRTSFSTISEMDCGQQLRRSSGALTGVSSVCLRAILHTSIKECEEAGDNYFCLNVKKGIKLNSQTENTE